MRRSFRTLRLCAIPGVSPRAGMQCPVGALRMPHLPSSLPAPPRSGSGNGPERALERRHPDPQRATARKPSLSPRSLRAKDRTPKSTPAERDRSAASLGSEHQNPSRTARKPPLQELPQRAKDRSREAPNTPSGAGSVRNELWRRSTFPGRFSAKTLPTPSLPTSEGPHSKKYPSGAGSVRSEHWRRTAFPGRFSAKASPTPSLPASEGPIPRSAISMLAPKHRRPLTLPAPHRIGALP
jgi:hypothetical protein